MTHSILIPFFLALAFGNNSGFFTKETYYPWFFFLQVYNDLFMWAVGLATVYPVEYGYQTFTRLGEH